MRILLFRITISTYYYLGRNRSGLHRHASGSIFFEAIGYVKAAETNPWKERIR
jgi:hypothetical protein